VSPDVAFWLAFTIKLTLTAGIVVTASIVAERAGALIGALVVTLPVTVWPAYVFLALDHDQQFIAESAVGGLVINAVNAMFMLVYCALAQRRGLTLSLLLALATWLVLAAMARLTFWSMAVAILINVTVYPACIRLSSGFRLASIPPTVRRWYDVPVRTALVCALMGTLLLVSNLAGPIATGFLAVFPISTTSTMLILHPRVGGPATAAVVANGLFGLAGISVSLLVLHYIVGWSGVAPALALALTIPVMWNLLIWVARTRRLFAYRPRAPALAGRACAATIRQAMVHE
jgi:hypothetical protein